MSDVTVIGLGAMGSAIAKAELQAGHTVTVWNRSPSKINLLVELGASDHNLRGLLRDFGSIIE
jgi:3-hydroxyisobutyrate dehydrogenase-like beta-hydroxyacid dehydrogenase